MKKHALITDAHTLAIQQLERLRILLLLLPEGREQLPACQQDEADAWMFEMVNKAQKSIEVAGDAQASARDEDAATFATALDAVLIVLDGGTRAQQQASASGIREILTFRGYPIREGL